MERQKQQRMDSGGPASRPAAVLIVDDDPHVTSSLARSLRGQFTIFTAASAEEALAILLREPIAVILTDQRMPVVSGVELLARARQIRPDTRGLILSGYTDPAALVEALNLGTVQGFIAKPWDIAALRRRLDQLVHDYQTAIVEHESVAAAQTEIASLRHALDELQAAQATSLELVTWESEVPASILPAAQSALATTAPATFAELVASYRALLNLAAEQRGLHDSRSMPDRLRVLSERLGMLWAGPRDLIEVHTVALRQLSRGQQPHRIAVFIEEGRLLLLELMGHLLNFYRTRLAAG